MVKYRWRKAGII